MTVTSIRAGAAADTMVDTIQPFPRSALRDASELLFDAYRTDPTFLELYGFASVTDASATRPIFREICEGSAILPNLTLGCHRDGRVVGVVSYVPNLKISFLQAFCRRPVAVTAAHIRWAYLCWRYAPRLPGLAKARWRAYTRLARAQAPAMPSLQVLALGVAEPHRRTGVARQLLDAVAGDARWPGVEVLEVETWHPSKVSTYERLGFRSIAHGRDDGVEWWTMVRPLVAPLDDAPVA
jgi:GNAT superfamily N-acetyltransferase